jgi:hypothetical protein
VSLLRPRSQILQSCSLETRQLRQGSMVNGLKNVSARGLNGGVVVESPFADAHVLPPQRVVYLVRPRAFVDVLELFSACLHVSRFGFGLQCLSLGLLLAISLVLG